jgi:hypothetical protein
VSGSDDSTLRLWSINSSQCIAIIGGHLNSIKNAVFSPCGSRILSGSSDGTIRLWDANSRSCIRIFSGYCEGIEAAAFDKSHILSKSSDGTLRLWDRASGTGWEISQKTKGKLLASKVRLDFGFEAITDMGTINISRQDRGRLEFAALQDGGYAVLEMAPGETCWKLTRAKGEYWRYVKYVSDTLPDGTPGRVLYSADVLGEVPEV